MSANDNSEIDCSLTAGSDELASRFDAPTLPMTEEDDDSWMDVHTLNLVPYKNVKTIQVTVRHGGRGKPLPHPGIWDDDE